MKETIPLETDELAQLGERILELPEDQAVWVTRLYEECVRARVAEAEMLANSLDASSQVQEMAQDVTQIVLDAAEWLRTLWEVGYMGNGRLPASPRSSFPQVEVEDVLKSALLARIRSGRRPLPFPPPTRDGVPWHEIVEEGATAVVVATAIEDSGSAIAFSIAGDPGWNVLETLGEQAFRLQHGGKGPLYRLARQGANWCLEREAPILDREIRCQTRAGLQRFLLHWPQDDGSVRTIPLRAAGPDRAETDAQYWLAREHPERYGQIRFVIVFDES